jgi:hypothetical protein
MNVVDDSKQVNTERRAHDLNCQYISLSPVCDITGTLSNSVLARVGPKADRRSVESRLYCSPGYHG